MSDQDYLVSYGCLGDFGRFRPLEPFAYQRGDQVVVRSQQGVELGVVLCPATAGHAQLLPHIFVGQLLRRVTPDDQYQAAALHERAQQLFEDGQRLLTEMALPIALLDVDILLDGQLANLHHLRWDECDERPLVSTLSKKYELLVSLRNLALPPHDADPENGVAGCGKPDCGHGQAGECTSCASTGGGCSTGCGSVKPNDLQAYFAGLRRQMNDRSRVPLL